MKYVTRSGKYFAACMIAAAALIAFSVAPGDADRAAVAGTGTSGPQDPGWV
ncbi:hypothetical protein GCM10010271_36260 [Streptomyces kurssanovii]|nr:hypothetical protein GCM10010271_36260 [Streptomyces kurssanovii]